MPHYTQKIINTQPYFRLVQYVAPYKRTLVLALFAIAILALTLSTIPAFIMQLFEHILIGNNPELIPQFVWILIALLSVGSAASYISTYTIDKTSNRICTDLRLALYNKLLALPITHDGKPTCRDLTDQFIADFNKGAQALIYAVTIFVKNTLMIIFLLLWMFYLSWEFSLFILLILSVMILISQLIHHYLDKTHQQLLDACKKVSHELHESVSRYQLIRVHGGQAHERDRFKNEIEKMQHFNLRQTNIKTLSILLGQILSVVILFAISYFLIQEAHNDKISISEVAALMSAATMLFLSLNQTLSIKNLLLQGQQQLENIFSFLDKASDIDTGTVSIEQLKGELIFDKINFIDEISKQLVLDNVSFIIKPGETTAIICTKEYDKTVLIDLILRMMQPTSGKILLDGHDLSSLKLSNLYRHIALISHKYLLFDDTVASNIAYGEIKCADEAKITAAAFATHVASFIREMPNGLQTKIGEDGVILNQVQRQLVAIARALLRDPSILIIDEIFTPESSDAEIEHLQDALETLIQGRTTLFITQKRSTLVKVNHVFKLKSGKITKGYS